MNKFDISVAGNEISFRPGQWIEGRASWQLARAVADVEIRLIWFTQGKGDTDISVLDTQRMEHPALSDARNFRFQLPDAPYSFSGKVISLIWAIEIVAEGIKEAARYEFFISPDGLEVELGSTTKHLSPQEIKMQQRAIDLTNKLTTRQK